MRISQREARRLKKRVDELEQLESQRQGRWASDYPGGVNFWTLSLTPESVAAVKTAKALGHYIVAVPSNNDLRLHAMPFPKV